MTKFRHAFKIWLETDDGYVFGPGVYALLLKVKEKGTLKEAASSLEMSYRYAWGLIKKAEKKLGNPLIEAHKGGRYGGGSTEITDLGLQFIDDFKLLIENISDQLKLEDKTEKIFSFKIVSIKKHPNYYELELSSKKNLVSRVFISKEEFPEKLRIGDNLGFFAHSDNN